MMRNSYEVYMFASIYCQVFFCYAFRFYFQPSKLKKKKKEKDELRQRQEENLWRLYAIYVSFIVYFSSIIGRTLNFWDMTWLYYERFTLNHQHMMYYVNDRNWERAWYILYISRSNIRCKVVALNGPMKKTKHRY